MVPLIAYVDRFSARPGERVAVKVSSELGEPYRADLVRIIHGDANPSRPGLKFEEVAAPFAGMYQLRFQPVHSGSYGLVVPDKPLAFSDPCTIVVRIQPWLLDHRRQTVLAIEHAPTLWVTADGVGLAFGGRDHRLAAPMLKRRWYELRLIGEDEAGCGCGRPRCNGAGVWLTRASGIRRLARFARQDFLWRRPRPPLRAHATTPAATSPTGGSRTPPSSPAHGGRRHRWRRTMQIVLPGGISHKRFTASASATAAGSRSTAPCGTSPRERFVDRVGMGKR